MSFRGAIFFAWLNLSVDVKACCRRFPVVWWTALTAPHSRAPNRAMWRPGSEKVLRELVISVTCKSPMGTALLAPSFSAPPPPI